MMDVKDGKVLDALPLGAGTDGAVFNPATMEAFSSQGDGTLTIIKEKSPTSFEVEQTVTTPVRAKTLTLDAKTGHVLLITAEYAAPPAPAPGATPPPGGRGGRGGAMVPDSFMIVVFVTYKLGAGASACQRRAGFFERLAGGSACPTHFPA